MEDTDDDLRPVRRSGGANLRAGRRDSGEQGFADAAAGGVMKSAVGFRDIQLGDDPQSAQPNCLRNTLNGVLDIAGVLVEVGYAG